MKPVSVSQLNKYIKSLMGQDELLSNISIVGEISNFKHHSSGHMYFSLKDEKSIIKCVMFRSHTKNLCFKPSNGVRVIAYGNISVYEAGGMYQLYPTSIKEEGIGDLFLKFEQLKKKLEQAGLFSNLYKKDLPMLPLKIGVITSPTGSVIRDIKNVLYRRYPNISLTVFPAAVQGVYAANQICTGIQVFNEINSVELIILARGGGSIEELWSFNEEIVAKAIYKSQIPIVSAIGHETDFSISDFVADLRAPTPSVAAELVVAEKRELVYKINKNRERMVNGLKNKLKNYRNRYEKAINSYPLKRPLDRINQHRIEIDGLTKDLINSMNNCYQNNRQRFLINTEKLDSLSPLKILTRGYSIAKDKNGGIIKSVNYIRKNDNIEMVFKDGNIECVVSEVCKYER